jgi:hypothetical protein
MKELGNGQIQKFFPARSSTYSASIWPFSCFFRACIGNVPYGKIAKKETAKETLCCGFNQSGEFFST